MLKPVSPLCVLNVVESALKPAGAVHGAPTIGLFVQYSNSIEPRVVKLGIVKDMS
jgi:hypothetical protein